MDESDIDEQPFLELLSDTLQHHGIRTVEDVNRLDSFLSKNAWGGECKQKNSG